MASIAISIFLARTQKVHARDKVSGSLLSTSSAVLHACNWLGFRLALASIQFGGFCPCRMMICSVCWLAYKGGAQGIQCWPSTVHVISHYSGQSFNECNVSCKSGKSWPHISGMVVSGN